MSGTTTDDPGQMGSPPLEELVSLDRMGFGADTEQTALTPLQEIEFSIHDRFQSDTAPPEDEVETFLRTRYPKMDGGVTVILLAGLIIQGWRLFREEQDRRRGIGTSGVGGRPPKYCGECGNPTDGVGKPGCTSFHRSD